MKKGNKKIIFLDVDGVLNSEEDFLSLSRGELPEMPCEVFDRPLKLLKQIIDKTGAEVVISSSWRITLFRGTTVLYNKLINKLGEFNIKPIGVTPILSDDNKQRGDEIRTWLENNCDITHFIILDDDSDMCEFTETNLVQTTYEYGLREEHVKKAIEILSNNNVD